jgi:hypothetical protein
MNPLLAQRSPSYVGSLPSATSALSGNVRALIDRAAASTK